MVSFRYPRVCIATASPWKFSEALAESGADVKFPQNVEDLFSKEERYEDMNKNEDWEEILRNKILDISKTRKLENWMSHCNCYDLESFQNFKKNSFFK